MEISLKRSLVLNKEKVICIICGKKYPKNTEDALQILHPTKRDEVTYACKNHPGIQQEHSKLYPPNSMEKINA